MHKLAILNCHVKKLDFFSFEKVRKLDMMTFLSFWGVDDIFTWYTILIDGRSALKNMCRLNLGLLRKRENVINRFATWLNRTTLAFIPNFTDLYACTSCLELEDKQGASRIRTKRMKCVSHSSDGHKRKEKLIPGIKYPMRWGSRHRFLQDKQQWHNHVD